MKVIFVGLYNKPEMKPLDSRTKSGKLIDRVIGCLRGDDEIECVKMNYFDRESIPSNHTHADHFEAFFKRVGDDRYLLIALGKNVQDWLHPMFTLKVAHPASVWSNIEMNKYVASLSSSIIKFKAKDSLHTDKLFDQTT